MGTIRSRMWRGERVWFVDYIAADGRRIRQTIGASEDGKRVARQVLKQREAEAQLGIHNPAASRTMKFAEFAEDWLRRATGRNLAPKTFESYEGMLRCHLIPAFGEKNLGAITKRDVELFQTEARTVRKRPTPLSPKSSTYALTILKTILTDAVDQGHLQQNPAAKVKPPIRPDREEEMQILRPGEVQRLIDAAEEPWRTLFLLAVHTGLRRGELLGLRWRDVDPSRDRLHVRRSLHRVRIEGAKPDAPRYTVREAPLKTKKSRRTIDLSPVVAEALLVHPAGDDPAQDFVFRGAHDKPISPDAVDSAFRRTLTLAGLPEIRFHDMRHTHASLLIAAGVHPKAIQARLGHSSITVTMDRYGHLMPSAFEGVGEKLDALLNGKLKANERAENPQSAETRVNTGD